MSPISFSSAQIVDIGKETKDIQSDLARLNESNFSSIGNIYGFESGISPEIIASAKKGDVFSAAANSGQNTTTVSQNNNTQQSMSTGSSSIGSMITEGFNLVKNGLSELIQKGAEALTALTDSSGAEAGAMEAPQTSGQTVNAEENMTTDNQGSDNKAATPDDSNQQKIGLFGGEAKIADTAETSEVKDKEIKDTESTEDPEKAENEQSIFNAETLAELNKASMQEIQEQNEENQKKQAEEEAARNAQAG